MDDTDSDNDNDATPQAHTRDRRALLAVLLGLAGALWLSWSWWHSLQARPHAPRRFDRVMLLPDAPPAPPPSASPTRQPDPAPRKEAALAPPLSPETAAPPAPAHAPSPDARPDAAPGANQGLSPSEGLGDGGLGIGMPGGDGPGGEGRGGAAGGLGHRLYSLQLQRRLQERLGQEASLQSSHYSCQLSVWIGSDGSVSQIQLQRPSGAAGGIGGIGEAGVCDGLPALMRRLGRIADPPPANLHQPVVLRVANRAAGAPALASEISSDPARGQGLAARP